MDNEKPLSWTDIEISFMNSTQNGSGETDGENLAYFKKKILAHLEGLQAEEDKKIIPFPAGKPKRRDTDLSRAKKIGLGGTGSNPGVATTIKKSSAAANPTQPLDLPLLSSGSPEKSSDFKET
jgi:hypothetical protein